MPLFSSAEQLSAVWTAHIRGFEKLYAFHSLRAGSPADFLQLGPKLASSEGFRLDFSDLVRTVRDREGGRLSAAEMLTIVGLAVGGPGIARAEMELVDAAGMVQVLLAGVGGWREPDMGADAWMEGVEGGVAEEADRNGREAVEREWAGEDGGLRADSPRRVELGADGELAVGGEADVSPEMRETLDRLELANMQLKIYLDDIDRRIGRIEPNLGGLAAEAHASAELSLGRVDAAEVDGAAADRLGAGYGKVRWRANEALGAALPEEGTAPWAEGDHLRGEITGRTEATGELPAGAHWAVEQGQGEGAAVAEVAGALEEGSSDAIGAEAPVVASGAGVRIGESSGDLPEVLPGRVWGSVAGAGAVEPVGVVAGRREVAGRRVRWRWVAAGVVLLAGAGGAMYVQRTGALTGVGGVRRAASAVEQGGAVEVGGAPGGAPGGVAVVKGGSGSGEVSGATTGSTAKGTTEGASAPVRKVSGGRAGGVQQRTTAGSGVTGAAPVKGSSATLARTEARLPAGAVSAPVVVAPKMGTALPVAVAAKSEGAALPLAVAPKSEGAASRDRVEGARAVEVVRAPRTEDLHPAAAVDRGSGGAAAPVERAGALRTETTTAAPVTRGPAVAAASRAAEGSGARDVPRVPAGREGVSAGASGGRLISAPTPIYPSQARMLGVEGKVVVRASVDVGGRVSAVQVLDGPGLFRSSAEDAVRRRRYQPFVVGGKPSPFETVVTLNYRLEH